MNTSSKNIDKSDRYNLTQFEMPEIWNNEDEIYNLMQTFKRPRAVDPTSYDFKINFWSSLIQRYAKHNHVLVANVSQFQSVFEKVFKTNGVVVRPLCLDRVFSHLKSEGKLIPLCDYKERSVARRVISGVSWMVIAPVRWSYQQVSSIISSNESTAPNDEIDTIVGDHILIDFISEIVQNFLCQISSHTHWHVSPRIDIVSLSHYNQLLADYIPHHSSRLFVHEYLLSHRLIELVTLPDKNNADGMVIVKFARSTETPFNVKGLSKCQQKQVTALVQLRTLGAKLETDEEHLKTRVDQMKENVRRCIRIGKREEAKNYLRRGKIIEKMLEQKRTQIENVDSMLIQIEAAEDNVQVMNALSCAAGALRAHNVDVDNVRDTMADIGDAMADQEEINASISAVGDQSHHQNMDDLEAELAALLVDDGPPAVDSAVSYPEVPTNDPLSTKRRTPNVATTK